MSLHLLKFGLISTVEEENHHLWILNKSSFTLSSILLSQSALKIPSRTSSFFFLRAFPGNYSKQRKSMRFLIYTADTCCHWDLISL